MEIKVMGYGQALRHIPTVPTLAIRIFDSFPGSSNTSARRLPESSLYTIREYVFDDLDVDRVAPRYGQEVIEQWRKKYAVFDEEMAQRIVDDFARLRSGNLELLVHCTLGVSRSPAVAVALNEIFDIGYDIKKMKREYNGYNRYVYRLLKEVSSAL